jgi:CheY-like chemotaxis protein
VPTVLFVDDDLAIRGLLERILGRRECRFRVLVAGSGREALERLQANEVAMIVTDVHMPGLSGLDVITIVREQWPHVLRAVMTSDDSDAQRKLAQRAGASHFWTKPFMPAELADSVAAALGPTAGESGLAASLREAAAPSQIQPNAL